MSAARKPQNQNHPAGAVAENLEFDAEVLFQRICGKWYAFSVKDEECFMAKVPEDEVTKRFGGKPPRPS